MRVFKAYLPNKRGIEARTDEISDSALFSGLRKKERMPQEHGEIASEHKRQKPKLVWIFSFAGIPRNLLEAILAYDS